MARGYAHVHLVGNLGKDPELKYLESGDAVCNFSIAVNRKRKDVETTDWYNVACFRRNAEVAAEYLTKGSPVMVAGQLSIRKYTGNDGSERTSVEVNCDTFTMLGSRPEGAAREDEVPYD